MSDKEIELEMQKARELKLNYFEFKHKLSDGTIRDVEVSSKPIRIDNKKVLISIIHDITDKKLAREALIKAKEKAEESDRLKSAFLANMSHEIRTPMNGILGFANLLQEPNLSGKEKGEFIDLIQKSGNRMLNTVNDLIDISRVETGQVELSITEFNICEEINNHVSFFKPEADKKGLKLILKNSLPECDGNIKSDLLKLNSIFNNLIKNAIKFTDKGVIEIGANKKDNQLECYVKDTGIGIPKNRQKAVFDRFVQSDITDKRAFEGSGLGLAITKAYVEILGGKLWLESKEGYGSTFYFNIPFENSGTNKEEETKQKTSNLPETASNKIKVLIAEDDELSFEYLSIVLSDLAEEIIRAKTGLEAIEICKKNPNIDIVFMDIKMPELNGYEATKKIREFNKEIVIIAQTAFALSGDQEKSLEVGCNDYISKPIDKTKLREVFIKWIN